MMELPNPAPQRANGNLAQFGYQLCIVKRAGGIVAQACPNVR